MIQVKRRDASKHTVSQEQMTTALRDIISKLSPSILFVCGPGKKLIGVITPGDLLRNSDCSTALEVCNKNPSSCSVLLDDPHISRFFTDKIQCIPLVNELGQLSEIAYPLPVEEQINLNIGSGGTTLEGFINLDISSDWYADHHNSNSFIEYNILTDKLPFERNTVDNIYCSHVIEHITDDAVKSFLADSINVLKKNSVLRIACPDADFLLSVSQFENDFWFWRREWFLAHQPEMKLDDLKQYDFLIREVATERVGQEAYTHELKEYNNEIGLKKLTSGLQFNSKSIGNHINYWTFEKISNIAKDVGFSHCIRSKYQGSVSIAMKGKKFDQTRPEMSLYIDLIK